MPSKINNGYLFSLEALHHPEAFPAFPPHGALPATFNKEEINVSVNNAWWLSKASHLAYFPKTEIETQLSRVALELYGVYSAHGTLGFIATGNGFAWLSFRGTRISEKDNLKNNLDIRHNRLSGRVSVHEGFHRSLDYIWPEIAPALQELTGEGYKLWYTGHSLGAAMATLAATRIEPAALYTFGSPRVGNRAFCQLLESVKVYRFVNCCDAVPLLPPARMGFHHVGEEWFLTSCDELLNSPGRKQRLKQKMLGYLRFYKLNPWLTREAVKFRSLADHIVMNYSNALLFDCLQNHNDHHRADG